MKSKQLVVASEYSEPSNHSDIICQRLYSMKKVEGKDICLLLITKNLPKCLEILGTIDALGIPTQIHCTITGLGGSSVEPHIPSPDYILEQSLEVIKKYRISPEAVTLRIDPIIPELLAWQMNKIPHMLESFAEVGVRDCRISIVDYYPHVRERFDRLGIEHPGGFQVGIPLKNLLIGKISYLTIQLGMRLHLCAESLPASPEFNIDTEGCASNASWARLGIDGLKPLTRRQRPSCTCDLSKIDLLRGLEKGCEGGCAYCYWKRKGE